MKKRLACGLFAAMMIVSLAACNKSDKSNEAVKNMTAEECKEYITLGDYKNIEVDVDKTSLEVTDAEIQAESADKPHAHCRRAAELPAHDRPWRYPKCQTFRRDNSAM